jgi:hypothetical protein
VIDIDVVSLLRIRLGSGQRRDVGQRGQPKKPGVWSVAPGLSRGASPGYVAISKSS